MQKQKEDALEYVIEHYSSLVNAIAYKILSGISLDAIEECVNDVFLAVWQNAGQFKGELGDFKKWIKMITKYKAIDLFRKLEKQQAREYGDELLEQKSKYENLHKQLVKNEEKKWHQLLLIYNRYRKGLLGYYYTIFYWCNGSLIFLGYVLRYNT